MKKAFRVIIIFVMAFLFLGVEAKASERVTYVDNKNGTVTVKYNNSQNKKIKIAVFKGDSKYYYNLANGYNSVKIPLTAGNGDYTLILCKNTVGNKYMTSDSNVVKLDLEDEKAVFLQSCQIINWNTKNVAIKKAKSLTKKSKTEDSKIKVIYDFIVKNYTYDYDKIKRIGSSSGYIPDIDDIYVAKTGICYDISSLMAGMLRSVKIPTQVVTGYTKNANAYHAWNEIYRSKVNKWIIVDATYDLQMYKAGRKYEMEKNGKDYKDIVYRY